MTRDPTRVSAQLNDLPPQIAQYVPAYIESFGAVPPIPAARLPFGAAVAPELTEAVEAMRARALYNDVFDRKLCQLIAFGFLADNPPAAYWHAKAARRGGASWQELVKIVELALMFGKGFGAFQLGMKTLADLWHEEQVSNDASP